MVDFQVSTDRMPATANINGQVVSVKGILTATEKRKVIEYVTKSFGNGRQIVESEYTPDKKLVSMGGELFRQNCASCHNFAGKGGALSEGAFAVPIDASPKQIYEAMLTGPTEMPSFTTLNNEEQRAIISYIYYVLHKNENPGGLSLGRFGPVGEGAIVWMIIMTAIVGVTVWISTRK
jgi:ubiquinol-cytochrome c reductase cytochrome c subunit